MTYEEFIASKSFTSQPMGIKVERASIHPALFDYQKDLVAWALARGKAAVFANTGLGKTLMQLEWSRHIQKVSGGNVLILAPLAVANQTAREAEKIDLPVQICASQEDVRDGVNITNYEKLHKFDPDQFTAVVLDESSILKAYDSKTRTEIINSFQRTPYKLACTATPAPNDYMELGNHAEFLNIMSRTEMLSMFFVHDGGDTSQWRLKGHAEEKFWEWVSSWGAMIRKPSDLGYDDSQFELPPLNIQDVVVDVDKAPEGYLFAIDVQTLQERQAARRSTVEDRCKQAAEIANATREPVLVWCDYNAESELLAKLIPASVEVKGSDTPDHKTKAMLDFTNGDVRCLISKASICGWGMNWQHCNTVIFAGVSDSFEAQYQAIRRCYRFGQTKPVNVYMVTSTLEGAVSANIKRKEADFERMQESMSQYTRAIVAGNVQNAKRNQTEYRPTKPMIIPDWLKGA